MVVKIGGSLLRKASDYVYAAENIKRLFIENNRRPIIVISASKGVTDTLIQVAMGNKDKLIEIENKYLDMAHELGSTRLIQRVREEISRLRKIVENIQSTDPSLTDYILSHGEKLSKIIMVNALELQGVNAFELNAVDLVITNNKHGDAVIDYPATSIALEKIYHIIKERRYVPVLEGFIGRSVEGYVTTLGRGGSDYTATAIAALLRVDRVYLVTDVDGIMTCDPDLIPSAKLVKYMSYMEALEAAMYGVKGINPKAFDPLEKIYGSNVYVGSWKLFGTFISKRINEAQRGPKLIVIKDTGDSSYIAIVGEGVSRTRFLRNLISIIDDLGIEVNGIQSHVHRPSLIVYVNREQGIKALKQLHRILFEGD
ncbi:MAG: aspartate kinase [Desulfurococcaceae archaeon]